ncbi:MAG: PqqD family protein [Flavobacteriia bacterium]|nr:PqqD family protein [Flavobacteriia bacterium]
MYVNKNLAISDTGFIFNPSTGDSFSTNEVGKFIIDLLKQKKSKEEIISQIVLHFNVDKVNADKDLSDFFAMLKSYQLMLDENE